MCQTRFGHPAAWYLEYYRREKLNSFLWTVLREPTKRHISEFFHFDVSRNKIEPTDEAFQQYFRETAGMIDNYYVHFMKTDRPFDRQNGNHTQAVQHIMQEYDFIGILERLDESLVALQMILGLRTSDILYLRAKTSGGFDDGVQNEQSSASTLCRVMSRLGCNTSLTRRRGGIISQRVTHCCIRRSTRAWI